MAASGYLSVHVLQHVLERSGDTLTRENVMRQLASLDGYVPPMVLPGITLSTSADDYAPFKALQLQRFDGKRWVLFGPIMTDTFQTQ